MSWPVIRGSGGIRKARIRRAGTGKSGGLRVIYYFWQMAETLYLLAAYAKNEKDNLSKAELKRLAALVKELQEI